VSNGTEKYTSVVFGMELLLEICIVGKFFERFPIWRLCSMYHHEYHRHCEKLAKNTFL